MARRLKASLRAWRALRELFFFPILSILFILSKNRF